MKMKTRPKLWKLLSIAVLLIGISGNTCFAETQTPLPPKRFQMLLPNRYKCLDLLVSVRKHFESFESFGIQSGDVIREGHHRCGRRRTADVTTAANCDIRVT